MKDVLRVNMTPTTILIGLLFACALLSSVRWGENVAKQPNVEYPVRNLRKKEEKEVYVTVRDDSSVIIGKQRHGDTLQLPFPPFPPHVDPGITFSRSINSVTSGSKFHLAFGPAGSNHCHLTDSYGDDQCHYSWGDTLEATYNLQLGTELEEGDTIDGKFKVRSN